MMIAKGSKPMRESAAARAYMQYEDLGGLAEGSGLPLGKLKTAFDGSNSRPRRGASSRHFTWAGSLAACWRRREGCLSIHWAASGSETEKYCRGYLPAAVQRQGFRVRAPMAIAQATGS